MAKNPIGEIIGTIIGLFFIFVVSLELWGETILNFIKELFLLIFITIIIIAIVFGLIWYFGFKENGGGA